jgi:hypothetical protein
MRLNGRDVPHLVYLNTLFLCFYQLSGWLLVPVSLRPILNWTFPLAPYLTHFNI